MNLIVWLLVVYLGLFSAFGSGSGSAEAESDAVEPPPPSATERPDATPDSNAAPRGQSGIEQRFLSRVPLPTCGMVTEQEQPGQAPPDQVWGCLQDAADTGGGAELIRVTSTVEGDLIYTYYRVSPEDGLEMYTDARQDRFGGADWDYRRCRPSADLRRAPCQGDS